MAAINVAQDREFVKKMTIFDRHCAENGKLLTKILCNMLIESFGGFLYTGNTPKKVFTLFAKKKAALFRCGFEKSFLKVKNLSDFGKERVKWKREKDFKVHLVS